MKTLIVYATTHDCTKRAAEKLQADLPGEIKLQNLKDNTPVFVNAYDMILIGGSIHAGRLQGSVKKFMDKNMEILLQKKVGLFLCCGFDGEKAQEQFNTVFPEGLRNHATAHGIFGGAFDFNKMNFIEKAVIKKVSGLDHSVDNLSESEIHKFVEQMTN